MRPARHRSEGGPNGAITAQYVYTPYGVESPYNASGNPFRYTGRRLDAQWGVYYYRARYYDPQLGRFLETDPAGYVDSMNLYAYVGNNPLNATDPTGEEAFLGGRPAGGGYGHLYVAVVDDDGTVIVYSAGPSTGSGIGYFTGDPELRPMENVQATDAAASERDRNNPNAVVQLPAEIPDDVVHAVGQAALGHPDYDTGVVDNDSGRDGANSNSFGRAIVERSAEIAGVDPESIRNPQGQYPLVNVAARVQFDPAGLQRAQEIMDERQ